MWEREHQKPASRSLGHPLDKFYYSKRREAKRHPGTIVIIEIEAKTCSLLLTHSAFRAYVEDHLLPR